MIHNNTSHSNAKGTDITHDMTKENIKQTKQDDLQNAFEQSRKHPNTFQRIKQKLRATESVVRSLIIFQLG